ncbi:MAG: M20/M25/M40 family metallo-hydrolase [Actinobacteria bacterium]|nr:M20/M25/M40 family metallo-hydrolase [Actinomycetota bacterium]
MPDVLRLVAIDSVSRNESALAALVFDELRNVEHLVVERVGDNVIARTEGFHAHRILVAGHLDTVPGDPALAVIEGNRLTGLGACDMKGSLAVMLELAKDTAKRAFDVTWVFYAREEIARSESGLLEIAQLRPDLLLADAAIVAEPTGGAVEAGCQGTLRLGVTVQGLRAHTARPFTGRNAIHRLGAIINQVAQYEPRVAIDRSRDEAVTSVRELLGDLIEDEDVLEVLDWAPAAPPSLTHPIIQSLVAASGQPARAKVGWTDVATLVEMGVPATNFGAGDPLLAHRADEFVTEAELDGFATTLRGLLFS